MLGLLKGSRCKCAHRRAERVVAEVAVVVVVVVVGLHGDFKPDRRSLHGCELPDLTVLSLKCETLLVHVSRYTLRIYINATRSVNGRDKSASNLTTSPHINTRPLVTTGQDATPRRIWHASSELTPSSPPGAPACIDSSAVTVPASASRTAATAGRVWSIRSTRCRRRAIHAAPGIRRPYERPNSTTRFPDGQECVQRRAGLH